MAQTLPITEGLPQGDALFTGNSIASLNSAALTTPVRGYKFTVTFSGSTGGNEQTAFLGMVSFKSVEGFASVDIEALEYREGAFPSLAKRKVPGLISYSDITLTKGVYQGNLDMYHFIHNFINGSAAHPINLTTITAYNNSGTPAATWQVVNAWPIHYESTGFNADSSEILIETLTLTHEGCYRATETS